MGKKKSNLIVLLACATIISVIGGFIRNLNNHNEKAMLVVNSKILETATKCYLEEKCKDEITLNDLYEKEYLTEELINPLTKENMDKNMCIKFGEVEAVFCK